MSLLLRRGPGGRLMVRRTRPQPASQPPQLTAATIVYAGDRVGYARTDAGAHVDVDLPDALWLRIGDRVMLFHYPTGWVAVQRMVIGEPLNMEE